MIAHNKPCIDSKEIQAMARVLKSGWIAEGREVEGFEGEVCRYLGFQGGHGVAVSNGVSALYLVLLALGVSERDEVILPSYVGSSLLNAVFLAKAKPVLVDLDPVTFNISLEETKKKIGRRTKAVIVSHTFGVPADIEKFVQLGVPVIEDCALAIGATFKGRKVGTFGQIAIFSFAATKMLTTGYGGMAFSRNKKLVDWVRDYREYDCRRTYKPRFNFQLSDFQAALGPVQLKKLSGFLQRRKSIARKYYKILPPDSVWPPRNLEGKQPNFFRFLVRTKQTAKFKQFLAKRGVGTIVPMQTYELLHRYLGQSPRGFPISEEVAKTTLSLPVYPALNDSETRQIRSALVDWSKEGL